ncbi:hypothetical protein BCB4_0094 [Bacillus phage B4]|uniref:Uncharacterized protein n=2 Tax=Bequatrovirus B4 TaxID=1918005 RepID=J9Q956_9CAUD|nr:hypothetical protein BCB4_0094 [Bacillus phage B4]YP_009783688.1 hypothetical protein QLX26_gp092 [Bacillus phage B5S]MEB9013949.1 hypothetical protein [Bacillus cereus]AEW47326.1 hypothetical protein B5S_0092 [Bacillus phage B5S]AEZ65887.1 hypothetical protein BCB4_0094 [Bacillus phage B4]MEB9190704.1 hypothetical protein [Bacillus cereus]
MIRILAMRKEKYVGQTVSGHNCDFEYTDAVKTRHVLLGLDKNNQKLTITLWDEEGECGSGWCTASWGRISVEHVDRFEGYTHKSKSILMIPDMHEDEDYYDLENQVFNVSYDGGDGYYPGGYYTVDESLFIAGERYSEERPVWIFCGESGLGKSFIANNLEGMEVYETDTSSTLPSEITADVVVIGNKHEFWVSQIEERLIEGSKSIIVGFEEGERN